MAPRDPLRDRELMAPEIVEYSIGPFTSRCETGGQCRGENHAAGASFHRVRQLTLDPGVTGSSGVTKRN
jgi:hypothetical protein